MYWASRRVSERRNLPFKKDPVWRVYVDGDRRSGSVEYGIDGTYRKTY